MSIDDRIFDVVSNRWNKTYAKSNEPVRMMSDDFAAVLAALGYTGDMPSLRRALRSVYGDDYSDHY